MSAFLQIMSNASVPANPQEVFIQVPEGRMVGTFTKWEGKTVPPKEDGQMPFTFATVEFKITDSEVAKITGRDFSNVEYFVPIYLNEDGSVKADNIKLFAMFSACGIEYDEGTLITDSLDECINEEATLDIYHDVYNDITRAKVKNVVNLKREAVEGEEDDSDDMPY